MAELGLLLVHWLLTGPWSVAQCILSGRREHRETARWAVDMTGNEWTASSVDPLCPTSARLVVSMLTIRWKDATVSWQINRLLRAWMSSSSGKAAQRDHWLIDNCLDWCTGCSQSQQAYHRIQIDSHVWRCPVICLSFRSFNYIYFFI